MSLSVFAVIIGVVIVAIVAAIPITIIALRLARRGSSDRATPVLQAAAQVVDKRTQAVTGNDSRPDQHHFVTFQFPDGGRVELGVPPTDAGLLVVGDQGTLAWQGTRYQGFTRAIPR